MQVASRDQVSDLQLVGGRNRLVRARLPGEYTQLAPAGLRQGVKKGGPVNGEDALL
jgi:hypothetical protein